MATSIKVKRQTVELLKSIGKKGETYDDIINRLLAKVMRKKYPHGKD